MLFTHAALTSLPQLHMVVNEPSCHACHLSLNQWRAHSHQVMASAELAAHAACVAHEAHAFALQLLAHSLEA